MRFVRLALAAVLCLCALPVAAQDPRGKQIVAPSGSVPAAAIYCDDGTNHAVLCSFGGGGGGGGGGDPSNIATDGATAPTKTGTVGGVGADGLVHRFVTDNAGRLTSVIYSLPPITGTVGITGSVAVTGTFWQATQPISGSVTVANNADPATGAKQTTNTSAITATQAAPGVVAATANTVTTVLPQLTAADRGTIVGTTAVTLMPANANRRGWSVQNQSTSASCYVNGSGTASADYHSLIVGPGGYFEPDHHVGTGAISAVCSAANTSLYSREW